MNQVITPKSWGKSIRRFIDSYLQVEEAHIDKGGYSSVHLHERKWNEFIVSKGSLLVHIYDDQGKSEMTHELEPGIRIHVPPNIRHQFVATTKVVVYEVYFDPSHQLDPEDIIRFSKNGCYVKISPTLTNDTVEYCAMCNCAMAGNPVTINLNGAMRNICRGCSRIQGQGGIDATG